MNIVITSISNRLLESCLKTIKNKDTKIYLMWQSINEDLDKSLKNKCTEVIYYEDVYNWALFKFNINKENLDKQTTFKKVLLYSYLFEKKITDFFFTDDDVLFYNEINYSNKKLVLQKDPMLNTGLNYKFFRESFKEMNLIQRNYNHYLVGNFYISATNEMVDIYNNLLTSFFKCFNKADFKPRTKNRRNGKVFYLDSFFLNNYFIRISDKIEETKDWEILSGNLNLFNKGSFKLNKNNKKLLLHYNVVDKDEFFEVLNKFYLNEFTFNLEENK